MNPLSNPDDRDEATERINLYASNEWCNLTYSRHAREQCQKRIINPELVRRVLSEGRCVNIERQEHQNHLQHRYEMELRDQWGRVTVITVIVAIFHLAIVTTFTDIPDQGCPNVFQFECRNYLKSMCKEVAGRC